MPCNYTGLFDTAFSSRFGVVDYDWSNSKLQWANQKPMDAEERLIHQAELSHAMNPSSKVFIYRNLVHADNWMTSVREKLDDPRYSGFFVKFKPRGSMPNGKWHVPACDTNYDPPKCSTYYHDQVNTPQHNPNASHPEMTGECAPDPCDCGKHPCGEYVYDYRNGSMLQDFIVNEVVPGTHLLTYTYARTLTRSLTRTRARTHTHTHTHRSWQGEWASATTSCAASTPTTRGRTSIAPPLSLWPAVARRR